VIPTKGLVRAGVAALGALTLAGCISLFPKSDPAQLYRIDATAPANRAAPGATGPRGVLKLNTVFPRASGGDRILTVTGQETAFIAESRWVAPVQILFDEAVARAFDGPGATRLIGRGESGRADMVLRLDVRNFEAVYLDGKDAAPTVVLRMRAVTSRTSDRSLIAEKLFEAKVRAGDNRVGAIVAAFNEAVGSVLTELVGWTDAAAAALPPT
jgi:cholesterol transport system auxiliary component